MYLFMVFLGARVPMYLYLGGMPMCDIRLESLYVD
jgi:hypothetical protein